MTNEDLVEGYANVDLETPPVTHSTGLNVLSLCDGMSCGQIAFEKAGIKVDKYYASEIKKCAINATIHNFPNTIYVGDVTKIKYSDGILYTEFGEFKENFDIVIFGSPCQSFSRAMKTEMRVGLDDMKRSGLFLECNRILKEVNPKYFLMENVIMKPEDEDAVSKLIGIKPIRINASLVSAQLRDRLYWTNIEGVTIPKDKNIKLSDIIVDGYTHLNKAKCLMMCDSHGDFNGCNWNAPARYHRSINKCFGTMIFKSKEQYLDCKKKSEELCNGRPSRAEYFNTYSGNEFDGMRYLWKEERARLQGVPEKYVECMSEKDAADMLGDGWNVDVIAHIFSFI